MSTETKKPPTPVSGNGSSKSFAQLANSVANLVGSSWMFIVACGGVLIWGLTGPFFHYSNTWQLIVNTATTIITFLMVFLIQNTQNRDTRAINLKLDEVIRSLKGAHNEMINIEKLSDDELEELTKHYEKIRKECDHRAAARVLKDAKKKLPAA